MASVRKIHQSRRPTRRHFLNEWLEERDMKPADLLRGLNDSERSMDQPAIDKTQIYRWLRGQLPHPSMQERIAEALGFPGEPGVIFRHPNDDWISRFLNGRDDEEVERIKRSLEVTFPRPTGTND